MEAKCSCGDATKIFCTRCGSAVCDNCTNQRWSINLCSSCFMNYGFCAGCNHLCERETGRFAYGAMYCEDCFSDRFQCCVNCNDVFETNGSETCPECSDVSELAPTTFNIITSQRRIGMEIEFIPGSSTPNLTRFGRLDSDGSVFSDDRRGLEFVSAICSGDRILKVVDDVCRELSETGATVNKTCGLHIHLDMNDATSSQRRNISFWWQCIEPLIHGMVPSSRRNNQYSQACRGININEWLSSRYYSMNISDSNDHGTFEVRVHNGTVNPEKIKGWIRFLLVFFDTFQNIEASRGRLRMISDLSDRETLIFLFQQLSLPMSLKKYMVSRIKKHGTGVLILDKKSRGNPNLRLAA